MEWSGYLSLRVSGGLVTVWKRRWFELTVNTLTSFQDQGRNMLSKVSTPTHISSHLLLLKPPKLHTVYLTHPTYLTHTNPTI